MSPGDRLIKLGVIGSAHGVRGQVKVRSFASVPENMTAYGALCDRAGNIYDLNITSVNNDVLIASIEGINNRDDAEKLRNTELFIKRSALPAPSEDEYYHEDLIGLAVVTEDGKPYGHIIMVNNFGAGDIVEIKLSSGTEELLPFNKTVFPVIDIKNKKLVVSPPQIVQQDKTGQ